ncbi:MAG: Fe-S-containing protein [Bacteroidota bacterium]
MEKDMKDPLVPQRNCPRCGKQVSEKARFCIHCGGPLASAKPSGEPSLSRQRTPFSKAPKGPAQIGRIVFLVVAFVAFVGGGIAFFHSLPFHPHPVIETQPTVAEGILYADQRTDMVQVASRVQGGKIIILLRDVLEHRMVGFDYGGASVPISLVAFISPEGKLVTSIAFCEPCNSRKYHAQNNILICNACGTTWKLQNLEGISGSCQKYPPDPIPSVVVGDEIQIDESKVKNWKTRI